MPQKIYQFEGKSSEIKPPHPLCLGNVSEGFTANNKKKKTELNGYVYDFSVDYNIVDTSNIINIQKHLMKKHDIK